ncbi:probable RNA-binding protein 46 [Colletes gigas]|uniref:probable RNA-binding protein 46 n=1 Tax=Colletes gigas TaxID=935657 RepID=UPI001C9B84CA|nr:probable RNA-binding protein 46 [Colletes gigas]
MNPTKKVLSRSDNGNTAECQLTLRLLDMLQKTQYELVQENGQRRLTAPEITRGEKQRIKGAEIFLGRLPRDCYEDELMPILQSVGRLIELRLMLDFSGSTRGYAFALFENSKIARTACMKLNGYEIRPGHHIGVVKSIDNCRLFFGGVPKDKSKEEFLEELNKILDGIVDIYLYPSGHNKTQNRGFIFVEFKDHRAAAMARRKLIPGKVMLWEHEIAVDWADPEPGDPIDEEIMETVTALFVRNLCIETPQQKIRDIFQKTTKIPVLKLKKINHFAFIHYENRRTAQTVMNIMTQPNGVAEAEGWEIRWAKPIGATKILERQRCINEAVAKSYPSKCEQNHGKHSLTKTVNTQPCTVDINDNVIKDVSSEHMITLQKFIENKFNASCIFNCAYMEGMFMCKITILKDEKFLCEYHGDLMPTKQNAIVEACSQMYQFISTRFHNFMMQQNELVYMNQKLGNHPAIGSELRWVNKTNSY